MSNIADIRVSRASKRVRQEKAAVAAAEFIRRTCEANGVRDKHELATAVWEMYFNLLEQGMIVTPKTTRSILRKSYGFWRHAGVNKKLAEAI